MEFQIKRRTMGSRLKASALSAKIQDLGDVQEKDYANVVYDACEQHICTEAVKFTKEELKLEIVQQFQAFLEQRQQLGALQFWQAYCELDNEILRAWTEAFEKVHEPMIPRHKLSSAKLTEEEKRDALDPETPSEASA